jgi:hypothetical protein
MRRIFQILLSTAGSVDNLLTTEDNEVLLLESGDQLELE